MQPTTVHVCCSIRAMAMSASECGFVNVCDLPYLELVNACREAAAQMYRRRMTR